MRDKRSCSGLLLRKLRGSLDVVGNVDFADVRLDMQPC